MLIRNIMKLKATFAIALLVVAGIVFAQEAVPPATPAQSVGVVEEVPEDDKSWVDDVDVSRLAPKGDARTKEAMGELKNISDNIQSLKSDVIELNKDLRQMEEKLLFPSSTRFTVFVSLTTGQFFQLESVKLKLDGKLVASQMFSESERASMSRGGIHRLYVTNLNEGLHSATAFFTGVGPEGRPYKRAATIEFEKNIGSEYLELAVVDDGATQEAVFQMKRW